MGFVWIINKLQNENRKTGRNVLMQTDNEILLAYPQEKEEKYTAK